ncbi:MAG: hypothetical protein AAGC57_20660 [Pseudomonadota bacterium]
MDAIEPFAPNLGNAAGDMLGIANGLVLRRDAEGDLFSLGAEAARCEAVAATALQAKDRGRDQGAFSVTVVFLPDRSATSRDLGGMSLALAPILVVPGAGHAVAYPLRQWPLTLRARRFATSPLWR